MSFAAAGGHVSPCPFCQRPRRVHFSAALDGHLVETIDPCLCPGGRRSAGICNDCLHPVEGAIGKALRCHTHKIAAQKAAQARYRGSEKGRVLQERENERRRTDLEYKRRRRRWERDHRAEPEVKARRKQRRRKLAISKPEAKRAQHRRYIERYGRERLREQYARANAKRRQQARDYMHRYATKYVGPGKAPTCRDCGAELPFTGRGRPHARCASCDPKSWERDQSRAVRRREKAA